MIDIYTDQRRRWIRRQNLLAVAYECFLAAIILLAAVWIFSGSLVEVAAK